MARPRKEITEKNARKVVRYLVRLMKDAGRRRRVFAGDYEAGRKAQEELSAFPYDPEPERVESWCDSYLSQEDMKRMWAALRKERHAMRHDTKAVDLPGELYDQLASYAEREGLTLAEAVRQLLDDAWGGK